MLWVCGGQQHPKHGCVSLVGGEQCPTLVTTPFRSPTHIKPLTSPTLLATIGVMPLHDVMVTPARPSQAVANQLGLFGNLSHLPWMGDPNYGRTHTGRVGWKPNERANVAGRQMDMPVWLGAKGTSWCGWEPDGQAGVARSRRNMLVWLGAGWTNRCG